MPGRRFINSIFTVIVLVSLLFGAGGQVRAQSDVPPGKAVPEMGPYHVEGDVTPADREAAAAVAAAKGQKPGVAGTGVQAPDPGGLPHYFGPYANYANSPMPTGAVTDITLDDGGSGYTAPVVTITDVYGTGSGATATATVSGGVVTGITITDGGTGYSAPWVSIDDATGTGAAASATIGGALSGGIRKFIDSLPGLTVDGENNLHNYIPVAIPDQDSFPGADYYEIELDQYSQKFHTDLPPTLLRGYRQTNTTDPTVSAFHYLGPTIVATKDRPVRIKFTNSLDTGVDGDLFIPVDETVMGAGGGPQDEMGMDCDPMMMMDMMMPCVNYTQNRATLHLHGGLVPWISDGTPHQWTTPAGEDTPYPKGVSVAYVPDMWFDGDTLITDTVGVTDPPVPGATNNPGDGSLTFYYNNQQSARLMFYHDHAYGITRLNVYAGEVAAYVLTDEIEQDLINGTNNSGVNPGLVNVLPGIGTPLIIQDKTFVDAATIYAQDPTWNWGTTPGTATTGDLWVPSVYMPAQNPWDPSGASAYGRWQYGPWFWPPTTAVKFPPIPNEYYDPNCDPVAGWCEPPMRPDVPSPSMGMEAFNDTPTINGSAYPYMEVDPTVMRFRVLNGANDRFFNLQFYVADPSVVTSDGRRNTEVKMVPAMATPGFPPTWSTDGREGGVPDPATAGPSWIQIGTEGGFLPSPTIIPPQPINWNMNATAFNVGNVTDHSLLLGPAERADVLVDFSQFAGQTLILYNDAPTAFPALDVRYDYYTGNPSQTDAGGAPTTQPGYGPNTRTIMQVRVKAASVDGSPVVSVDVTNGGSDYASAPDVVFSGGVVSTTTSLPTAFASGGLDHATILNTGSGYTSAPSVIFSENAGTGAAASATVSVDGLTIVDGGLGYITPTVTITDLGGTGTGASADVITDTLTGAITGFTNFVPGSGYTNPQVTINDTVGTGASAVTSGVVDGLTLDAAGSGFTAAPSVVFTGGGGTGAGATVSAASGSLTGLTLSAGGSGYSSAPAVSFTGGGGSGAAATAILAGGRVVGLNVTDRGSGYTTAPTITFSGGGGSGASAVAMLRIQSVTLTDGGSGYLAVPDVSLVGGGGYDATAVATLNLPAAYDQAPLDTAWAKSGPNPGVFALGSDPIIVPQAAYNTAYNANFPADTSQYVALQDFSMSFFNGPLTGLTLTDPGSGYSTVPTVSFVGGGGGGAAATAVLSPGVVASVNVTNGGANYTSLPSVSLTGGGGTGAAATARGAVNSVVMSSGGVLYTSAPTVGFTGGGGGTGAAGTATLRVTSINITNGGTGYTTMPSVTFTGGGGSGATATARGAVQAVVMSGGGTGYTSAPTVTFSGGGGTGATATAVVSGGSIVNVVIINGGSGYTSAPTVNFTGGGGSGAAATSRLRVSVIVISANGSGYTSMPAVGFSGGGGTGAVATARGAVNAVTLTSSGSNYASRPNVTFTGGGGTGAAATTRLRVDTVTVTTAGSGYTSAPTVGFSGGGGTGAAATAALGSRTIASLTLTNGGMGYTSAPTVFITGGGGTGATATAVGVSLALEPKAIHDEMGAAFDDHGRMSGFLGLEMNVTNAINQNMVLYGYASPSVELLQDSTGTFLGSSTDGTQIWKITHNGVDTHPIHFHLFNVQLINRVAWDGALLPTEPNELGWKETVRVNPLEHTIVALRPVAPTQPFDIPNSVRPIDVTRPVGVVLEQPMGNFQDPGMNPVTILNKYVNFGWEYVWHCHILSHEEMDMMHSMSFAVAPAIPTSLAATYYNLPQRVTLTWTDNSINESGFIVQRSDSQSGPWTEIEETLPSAGKGLTVTYNDITAASNHTYYYRVMATNLIGDPTVYAAPAVGFPTLRKNSAPTNPGVSIVTTGNGTPGTPFIFASNFDAGVAEWAGTVGNVQVNEFANMGQANGNGLAAVIADIPANPQAAGPQAGAPAYVVDSSPDAESVFSVGFSFNPNGASLDQPVDIFAAYDADSQPVFGIQYEPEDEGLDVGEIRAWVMENGQQVFTDWQDVVKAPNNVRVSWSAGSQVEFSLLLNGQPPVKLFVETSGRQVDLVHLGPSTGVTAGDYGTMFFDEYVSSRIPAVANYEIYLPSMVR